MLKAPAKTVSRSVVPSARSEHTDIRLPVYRQGLTHRVSKRNTVNPISRSRREQADRKER